MNDNLIYKLVEVEKTVIEENKKKLNILKGINLEIKKGDSIAIVGPSGSGKTTLLNIMGGLDIPTKGKILFCGKDLSSLSPTQKAEIRNKKIGFIFQFHHLLAEFSVVENVSIPAVISGMPISHAEKLSLNTLELVGLVDKAYQPVNTLSGGEKQLTALARAVVMKPLVLLADEPTGNLDVKNAELTAHILYNLNKNLGTTVIVVTHNHKLASKMNRRIRIHGGEIQKD